MSIRAIRAGVPLLTMRGLQCEGASKRRRRHKKLFIGLSDLGQLTYCEIQSTISQLAMQSSYVESAFADDSTNGVRTSSRAEMTPAEREDALQRLSRLGDDIAGDWLLRRVGGRIAESLELSGTETERRHFDFGPFYVIGEPDAIDSVAVKEFSRSVRPRSAVTGKMVQCNLYLLLWERTRGDVVVVSYDGTECIERSIHPDVTEAERWLSRAWELISGRVSPQAPETSSRCRSCRYNDKKGCPFPRDG